LEKNPADRISQSDVQAHPCLHSLDYDKLLASSLEEAMTFYGDLYN
jgi:hypothetical protein